MRKLMFGKILSILLALIVVALSASGAVACTDNNCDTDDACDDCDNGCDIFDDCDNGCDACGACGNAWGEYGDSLGECGDSLGKFGNAWGECGVSFEEAMGPGPTWEELVLAFENDGFESWSGINLAGLSNL